MKLSVLAEQIQAKLLGSDSEVSGRCQTDSRLIVPGEIYVARVGESADGHVYLPQAVEKGAVGAIVTDPSQARALVGEEFPLLVVEDATYALGQAARYYLEVLRAETNPTVLGITGSAGKTTTKDLLAQVLRSFAPTVWPQASFNNEVGLPITVFKADASTRYLVLEMGTSAAGELRYLCQIAPLDVALELMVGSAHLGGFGGKIENVAAAKAELLEGLKEGAVAVLNYDDQRVRQMATKAPGPVVFFSAKGDPQASSRAEEVTLNEGDCPSYQWHYAGEKHQIDCQLAGLHNVSNSLAAATAAAALGLPCDKIAQALSRATALSPHRLSLHHLDFQDKTDLLVLDDSYNANRESVMAGLRTFTDLAKGRRKIAVLGQMLELGEESDHIHQEIADFALSEGIDILITVGEKAQGVSHSRHAVVRHAETAPQAIKLIEEICASHDAIFLKGSNGSKVWTIADYLTEGM